MGADYLGLLAGYGAAMAAFANSGQICCAGTRLFVERKIYDEFIARVSVHAAATPQIVLMITANGTTISVRNTE